MREVIEILKSSKLNEAYFGSHGFSIADEASISDLQFGYRVHPDGSDLCGPNEGDWQRSWIVIGTDTEVGDPFFVDTQEPTLPVYTAMHGIGEWSAELVATSLSTFLEVLSFLNEISQQKFSLIDPDEHTINSPDELFAIQSKLQEMSGEKFYWENFITQHREWLEEFAS